MKTVSFFGHRQISDFDKIEDEISLLLEQLFREESDVEFLVGRNGEFDIMVASLIKRWKKQLDAENKYLVLILPWESSELKENQKSFSDYYDEIEICQFASQAHPKAAYQIRNRRMVDRSDLVVFYVKNNFGGAYKTMQYAIKSKKKIINIANINQR